MPHSHQLFPTAIETLPVDTPNLNPDKYQFLRALRPFSFSVALITCGLGVAIAFERGQGDLVRALVVILAGVLLQGASNLANDHADLHFWHSRTGMLADQIIKQIRFNFKVAGLFTLCASVMGIWLVITVGWPLLLLGISGVLAGYFYTGEPIVYKHRGFGVPAVFILTGILMVSGAYYAVSGQWDNHVLWSAVPVSLISAALLVSNEIRDYLDDKASSIKTLTVRVGFDNAKAIYMVLLLVVFPISFYQFWQGLLWNPLFLLPSLLFIWQPAKLLLCSPGDIELAKLPPLTGRFFLVFGLGYILSFISWGQ